VVELGVAESACHEQRQESRPRERPTTFVDADGVRRIHDVEASAFHSPTEVLVLAVHKESLVETAHGLKSRTTNEEARSRQPVDASRTVIPRRVSDDLVHP
jgi:hypothetical protein